MTLVMTNEYGMRFASIFIAVNCDKPGNTERTGVYGRMRKTVLIMSVFAILAWPAAADEALLRQAWTIRDQDKAALLAEANTRLAELVQRWPSEPKLRNAPLRDDNVRWLLRNRMATYLVLDAELAKKPQGPARTVQLYLASRLRWRSLGQYLPPLLDECKTDAERLEVVQCMAAVRDAKSLQAMGKLLEAHKPDGNEGLLIAAVRGLGLSRQLVYLPVVQSARRKAKGPAARLAVAQAAVRCGDPAAMAQVAECLKTPTIPPELQLEAIWFLCENFDDQALRLLSSAALTMPDDELAAEAARALIVATRYGQGGAEEKLMLEPPPIPIAPGTEQPPAAEAPTDGSARGSVPPGLVPDIGQMGSRERGELVHRVVAWWETKGRDLSRTRRQQQVD